MYHELSRSTGQCQDHSGRIGVTPSVVAPGDTNPSEARDAAEMYELTNIPGDIPGVLK